MEEFYRAFRTLALLTRGYNFTNGRRMKLPATFVAMSGHKRITNLMANLSTYEREQPGPDGLGHR